MERPYSKKDTVIQGIDALGHGVAVWSPDGTLARCNLEFSRRFARQDPKELAGKRQEDFLRDLSQSPNLIFTQSREEWLRSELDACDSLQSSEFLFSDGSICQLERWPMPAGGSVSFLRDITEVLRNERTLQRERDKSTESERVKSRFLRAANHDLRQPLASLKILIYNCIEAQSDEERAQLLHNMDVSVSIMEDLLGALLNIGQLDAGRVKPKVSTFQVSTLLDRLTIQFEHQALEKGLDFRVMPSKAALNSDRALLERIVSNFVSNAIRYTDSGRVLVGCRRRGKSMWIEVWDSGIGIPEQHRQEIFKEFFRLSAKQIDRKHSLGLGLNIAKRMADVLQHEISVESVPGRGSVFAIKVPIGNVWHSDIGEPEINERVGGEFSGLTVLVMEDDDILREALVSLLERWGMEVVVFADFDNIQPLIAALEREPDLIITDYRLKGTIQGTDLVIEINDTIEKPCPAIVVTADTNPNLIEDIRRLGFPVLIKPVSPPSLRVTMHNILYEPELVPELQQTGGGDG